MAAAANCNKVYFTNQLAGFTEKLENEVAFILEDVLGEHGYASQVHRCQNFAGQIEANDRLVRIGRTDVTQSNLRAMVHTVIKDLGEGKRVILFFDKSETRHWL